MKPTHSQQNIALFTTCAFAALAGMAVCIAQTSPSLVEVESGTATFEAGTNMPGVEVKGKSSALTGRVELTREADKLVLQQVEASLAVKSLATGMKVRDEHMRKYIFTAPDGKEPDLRFTAEAGACPGTGKEFNCQLTGNFTLRGVTRPLTLSLRAKEQGGSTLAMRVAGDGLLKLSDYGIEPPSQFGVKPSNEVKIHLEFTGKQRQVQASNTGAAR